MEDFQDNIGGSFGFGNYVPDANADQIILATFVIDKSPSISNYVGIMNDSLTAFITDMTKPNSASRSRLMVDCYAFNQNVNREFGFTPITALSDDSMKVQASGHATALFEAVETALTSHCHYRNDLEKVGIDVKSFILIITDGDDTTGTTPNKVKNMLTDISKREDWYNSFVVLLYGVQNGGNFKKSAELMGINPINGVIEINPNLSQAEVRKQFSNAIGFFSKSISSGSSIVTF